MARAVSPPVAFDRSAFEANLQTSTFGRAIRYFDVVSSTNDLARSWCENSAPCGSVVYTEQQSAGRGRLQRNWISDHGKNLTFSVVIKNDFPISRLGLAVIGTAVSVGNTLRTLYGLDPVIRWPNDVLLNGKKCCGILFETEHSNGHVPHIIAGVGINVNQKEFPGDFRTEPTSIANELGHKVSREVLLSALLSSMEKELAEVANPDADGLHLRYQQHLLGIGSHIVFRMHDLAENIEGIAAGINRQGALEIMTMVGMQTFVAGEIEAVV